MHQFFIKFILIQNPAHPLHLRIADAQYAKEQDALEIEIAELEKAVTGYEQSQKSAEKFIALIDKYENFDTLTNTMHADAAFAVHVPTAAFLLCSVPLADCIHLRPEFQLYSPHISATAVLQLPESETG